MPEKESMSDGDFNKLLTRKMKEKGIPVYDLKDTINSGMVYGRREYELIEFERQLERERRGL